MMPKKTLEKISTLLYLLPLFAMVINLISYFGLYNLNYKVIYTFFYIPMVVSPLLIALVVLKKAPIAEALSPPLAYAGLLASVFYAFFGSVDLYLGLFMEPHLHFSDLLRLGGFASAVVVWSTLILCLTKSPFSNRSWLVGFCPPIFIGVLFVSFMSDESTMDMFVWYGMFEGARWGAGIGMCWLASRLFVRAHYPGTNHWARLLAVEAFSLKAKSHSD